MQIPHQVARTSYMHLTKKNPEPARNLDDTASYVVCFPLTKKGPKWILQECPFKERSE